MTYTPAATIRVYTAGVRGENHRAKYVLAAKSLFCLILVVSHSHMFLQVCVLEETYFSDLHCYPLSCKKQQGNGTDIIAVACTDGEQYVTLEGTDCKEPAACHSTASHVWGCELSSCGCAGTLKLIGSNGRLEKSVDAHRGAVLSVRWSPDGVWCTAGHN